MWLDARIPGALARLKLAWLCAGVLKCLHAKRACVFGCVHIPPLRIADCSLSLRVHMSYMFACLFVKFI